MSNFTPTQPHPVLQLPTFAEMQAMGPEAWMKAMVKREEILQREQTLPLWQCYEPPIWKVCDALIGAPWLDETEAEAIRLNLGFKHPVTVLYLLGAQRSSKTEYAINRLMRIMERQSDGLSWCFHNTLQASRDSHQVTFWKYLPANLKVKEVRSQTTYIAYKGKTGFSEEAFVLPNLHKMRFLSHDMDLSDLQGLNVNAAATDEFTPPDTVETLKARVAVKNGFVFVMFAPITGYTPLVQSASDGAEVVRESVAFLNPADGGPRDVANYLGLSPDEVAALKEWFSRRQKAPYPNVPWCRPEDCTQWLLGKSGQPAVPESRKFKTVPRIQRPADPEQKSAIVHFHGNDNPFGNPLSLYLLNSAASEEVGNRIFYGLAKEGMARMFPRFERHVHVMQAADIPTAGTNYMVIDPAGRNFFILWFRCTPRKTYVYREWPGNYEVPGQGVPGPWALPDGKLGDGRRGPAQDSFGFGLADYKREIARLEGWKDAQAEDIPPGLDEQQWISGWSPENGTREPVLRRFIDSRYASNPHLENDRPVTLLENFADIGLFFEPTSGGGGIGPEGEGVKLINDALRYDTTKKIDALNCPRLYISAECENTIFALRTWRNAERGKGASKDPIDCLRYFVLSGADYISADMLQSSGGGHY